MRGTWKGLGLLLVVPWLAACVSGPPVRLETGQGAPIVYRPPADEPPAVRVSQEEFVSALTDLVLQAPMSLELPRREGRVVRASCVGESNCRPEGTHHHQEWKTHPISALNPTTRTEAPNGN